MNITGNELTFQRQPSRSAFWFEGWRGVRSYTLIYFFLALINLTAKLNVTPDWFNGRLEHNHLLLTSFQYTNNEQSRLLQFFVPEALVRVFGFQITEAYLIQRWIFVWLAFIMFHLYLNKWFSSVVAFAGVCFLSAIMPLTYMNDLQESAPLLMVLFLAALWALRDRHLGLFAILLLLGALDNETILCLSALVFFTQFRSWQWNQICRTIWKTIIVSTPAYTITAYIRYVTRHQPHLGGAWHFPDNLNGIFDQLGISPLDYYRASYLYPIFMFGSFWVLAWLGWWKRPNFIRCSLLLIPLFILPHLVTGIIHEVRQMIPLAYIIIPAALFTLVEAEVKQEVTEGV